MLYLGGSNEPVALGPASVTGIRMRIGRALSDDDGLSWRRDPAPVLDVDTEEGLFASWPRVLVMEDGTWYMTYHAFNGSAWHAATTRTSRDTPRTREWFTELHRACHRVHVHHRMCECVRARSVFSATSADMGVSWVRTGRVLGPGDAGAFDVRGSRSVCGPCIAVVLCSPTAFDPRSRAVRRHRHTRHV
jgi:hypothetical protein